MLGNYFNEMRELFENIHPLLTKNGVCIVVVGNSSYGNIAIPTDKIFTELASDIGYRKAYFKEARRLGTSSQQTNNVDKPELLRESLVYLYK